MASSYRDILEDDHLEQDSIVTCRICFQCDGEEDEDLISPCMCKGTHQFVHRSCLDRWRSVKKGFHFLHCTTCKAQFHLRVKGNVWRKTKAGLFVAGDVVYLFSALQLVIGMLGGLAYLLGIHGYLKDSLINNHWDQILSRHPIPIYYGIGVFAFFTLLVMLVLIVLQCWFIKDDMLQFHIEPNDYPMSNTIDMDFVLARCFLSFVIYGIVSIMAVLLVATAGLPFYILTSWRQHNRIDTKKEHTKEYIVEDLHGCYTPAKLDPEHLKRLKTLKLL